MNEIKQLSSEIDSKCFITKVTFIINLTITQSKTPPGSIMM